MRTTQTILENKIANNMTSSMLIHPGEMIKDEIIARGITQKELAKQMGVSYTVFNEILNGKRPVTTEYALLLEAALGINASIWIGLQADYNMQKAKQDKSLMKRLEKIRKIAAIFGLVNYSLSPLPSYISHHSQITRSLDQEVNYTNSRIEIL